MKTLEENATYFSNHLRFYFKQSNVHYSQQTVHDLSIHHFCLRLDWKKLHPLSKRLATLGIRGNQLCALFKPFNMIVLRWSKGFQLTLNWTPMIPRDTSHSFDRCCFSSLRAGRIITTHVLQPQIYYFI